MGQSLSTLRWRRSVRSLQELAPRSTSIQELGPNLSREASISALDHVANYTSAKKQDITLVVVGGIINTIFLKNRRETHDVDFFNDNLPPAIVKCLARAAKSASKGNPILGQGWLNNRFVFFVPPHIRHILVNEALGQHEIVFQAPGLTLLAAPWEFLFCTKLHRLSGRGVSTATSYDQEDAVHYLERYISLQSTAAVPQRTVRFWFRQYLLDWTTETEELLPGVNSMYQSTFHVEHDPIIISS